MNFGVNKTVHGENYNNCILKFLALIVNKSFGIYGRNLIIADPEGLECGHVGCLLSKYQ